MQIYYKWIRDSNYDVYIVELIPENPIKANPNHPLEWKSDCVLPVKIVRFRDGKEVQTVIGSAYNYVADFTYEVGKLITGTYVYFCQTMDELMQCERGGIKYALCEYGKTNKTKLQPKTLKETVPKQYLDQMINIHPKKGRLPDI